jgi:uncharacterized protein YndB with AHSA1/START domain
VAVEAQPFVREVRIAARPETVFACFTEPSLLVRWKGAEATLEPQPGGLYRVVMSPGGDVVRGEYVEVIPHSRLVFTWGFEGEGGLLPAGASTVEVTFTPEGEGTLVRLVHRDLPGDVRDAHARGWAHYLDRLRRVAAGQDPGPDDWSR